MAMTAKLGIDGHVYLNGEIVGTWHQDENDHYIFSDLKNNSETMYISKDELRNSFIQGPVKPDEVSVEINGVRIPISFSHHIRSR